MARARDEASSRSDCLHYDPRILVARKGWNNRHDTPVAREKLEELKLQIIALGVQVPLLVHKHMGVITIVEGHRRHAATMRAISEGNDIKTVPCIQTNKFENDADRLLIQALDGVPKTPAELADIFNGLLRYGWKIADIAKKTGRSDSSVRQILEINALAPEVRAMVVEGEVAAAVALDVSRRDGESAAQVLTEKRDEEKAKAVAAGKDPTKVRVTAKMVGKSPEKLLTEAKKAFDLLPDEQIGAFMLWLHQTGRV